MKKTIQLILVGLILNSCSSGLTCCETVDDISTTLSGYWKEKKTNSKEIHLYSIKEGKGSLTDMEPTEKEGEYLIIDDHTRVDIVKKGNGFELKFTDLSGQWNSKIKHLDDNKLILTIDGVETEFTRVK